MSKLESIRLQVQVAIDKLYDLEFDNSSNPFATTNPVDDAIEILENVMKESEGTE